MKDIADYFSEPQQSSIQLQLSKTDAKNDAKSKRNRVRIKISRNSSEGKVCNILNSSSEMIDKTPSPNHRIKTSTVIHETMDLSSDDENSNHGSNAFQILMSQNKSVSPAKSVPQTEESKKQSEEYKQKLKQTREKLIMLADKKGYSKRKLEGMEESERIEKIIQNRIKVLKGDVKKDSTAVLSTRRQSSSLLNYFTKTTTDMACNESVSTIVVKADVHVAEQPSSLRLFKSKINNGIVANAKCQKQSAEFDSIDEIKILKSENIQINGEKKQDNKQRWSLRIKLHTYEDKNSVPDDSSDEEMFSSRFRSKSGSENIKKLKKISKEENEQNEKLKKPEKLEINRHKVLSDKNISIDNLDNSKKVNSNQGHCAVTSKNDSKRKTSDKLAPLFTKRRKPDPETLAARRLFLQSDLTDSNKSVDKKANTNTILPFPLISHVTQLNDTDLKKPEKHNVRIKVKDPYVAFSVECNYKSVIDISEIRIKPVKAIRKAEVEDVLAEVEKKYPDARKMWQNISTNPKSQQNKAISVKSKSKRLSKQLEKKQQAENPTHTEYPLWTLKYKPKNSQQVVGNEEAASKLRKWLSSWKTELTNDNNSSGDEFYSSDSNCSRISDPGQVAVLMGPHGCGKTASVYAVAEEFGYTVLEINASSRRTGKKLLKELEEATKSHRIKKEKNPPAFIKSDNTLPEKIPQNSLILIEDVDLVFEEDEGFVSAACQLASNTKRPIAMTCRDICLNLSKIAPQQNRIVFQSTFGNRVQALLELISLAETGCKLPDGYVMELLQEGDLRKAILQLQFLLLFGPPCVPEFPINIKRSLWQNTRNCLYKPAIKVSRKHRTSKVTEDEATSNQKNTLYHIAGKLDRIALLSSLVNADDPAATSNILKNQQPSLSSLEDMAPYSHSNSVCLEMAEWIEQKLVFKNDLNAGQQQMMTLKKQLNSGVNMALSQVAYFTLDQKVLATDYLPSIRTICRAEESRLSMNNKRGNRFFHYLHGLRTPSTVLKSNILSAACKIMQDTDNLT